jgi:hypothetical protein
VLNVNADTAAAALAAALGARKLVVLTDVEGVYAAWPDRDEPAVLDGLLTAARDLLTQVDDGMIPKLEACIAAVERGVPQAHVIDGRQPHSLLLEVFTSEGIGTMIVPDELAASDPVPTQGDSAMTANDDLLGRYGHALLGVFGTPALVVDRGEGCYVWDVDGKRYLDLLAGIAVNALGHNHPNSSPPSPSRLARSSTSPTSSPPEPRSGSPRRS